MFVLAVVLRLSGYNSDYLVYFYERWNLFPLSVLCVWKTVGDASGSICIKQVREINSIFYTITSSNHCYEHNTLCSSLIFSVASSMWCVIDPSSWSLSRLFLLFTFGQTIPMKSYFLHDCFNCVFLLLCFLKPISCGISHHVCPLPSCSCTTNRLCCRCFDMLWC